LEEVDQHYDILGIFHRNYEIQNQSRRKIIQEIYTTNIHQQTPLIFLDNSRQIDLYSRKNRF